MTAISPDSWGRRSRLVAWWAHHEGVYFTLLSLSQVWFVYTDLVTVSDYLTFPTTLLFMAIVNLYAFTVAHRAYLCETCLSKMPEDAQHQAQRKKFLLWTHHRINTLPAVLMMVALLIISIVLIPKGSPLHAIPDSMIGIYLIVGTFVAWQHRSLVMYCPWCKWGGGGHHERVPTPNPTMIKTG